MKKRNIFYSITTIFLLFIFFNKNLRNFFTESGCFLWAFVASPKSVGAIMPSSSVLAQSITRYIIATNGSINILEVGAGTGCITEEIVKKMRSGDYLDVIEIDQDFCEILKDKFKKYKNVKIHFVSILDWNPTYSYDYIISGLPFNAFEAGFVQAIFDKYNLLIKSGGILSYFEYIGICKIKEFFLIGEEKRNYSKTISTTKNFRKAFEFKTDIILLNVPPAYVHHLKM